MQAFMALRKSAETNGIQDMTLDEINAEIGKLSDEIKVKKAELKKLMKAKADMEKAAAEKKAQENKARILAAVEASGKSVDEILALLK